MYDPELRAAEDFDLWLRILRRGGRIVYNDRVLAYYRHRPGSHTTTAQPMLANVSRVLAKALRTMDLSDVERTAVERQVRDVRRIEARVEGKVAFHAGDMQTALRKFGDAHELSERRSLKMSLVLALLRVAPGPLRAVYLLRERFDAHRSGQATAR